MTPDEIHAVRQEKARFRLRLSKDASGARQQEERKASGRLAERLRRVDVYRKARTLLISPHPALLQMRINALADRKRLILPTPALQKGFLLIDGQTIPFSRLKDAAFPNLDNRFAKPLPPDQEPPEPIELLIAEALAAGSDGRLLGDGAGHLDLQYAVLGELGWLAENVRILAVLMRANVLPSLPTEPHDVPAHWLLTSGSLRPTTVEHLPTPAIQWDQLTRKRIRRSDLLFQLHRRLTEQ